MGKIKDAIRKIEEKRLELFNACTELDNLLIFSHFHKDDIPHATISNDGDVFLEYHGLELDKFGIEYYMREQGYITPADCDMPVQYIEEDPCSNCLLCAGMSRFSRVCFSYGYTKRRMTWELESIRIGYGNPEWGAPKDEEVFIIKLRRRIK